jgi:hypothetical protein
LIGKVVAFLKALNATVVAVVLLGLVTVSAVVGWRLEHAKAVSTAAELAVTKAKVDEVLDQLGGVQGTLIKERAARLTPEQQKFVGQIRKADPKATIDTVSQTKIEVADTAKGTATTPPGSPCPTSVADEYGRFRFDLPSGLLHRQQEFTLDLVTVRGVDGSYRVQSAEFREWKPGTKTEIPTTGVKATTNFQFVEEQKPGPGRFHLWGVAAVDHRAAPGGGVQIEPLDHLTASVLGFYSPKDKDFRGALHLGWRPGKWALTVGPYIALSTKGTGLVYGGAATIRVWGDPK